MKDEEERALFINVKKWILGLFLSSILGLTGFYFNTNYVIAQNTMDIKEIKTDLKKVTTVPVLNQNKIKNIQVELKELKSDSKENRKDNKENHKEDKIALQEMRKEQLKMLELLYQIKRQND